MMVSGRLGFEIAQKAIVAGIPVVASISAASSLAIELASDFGMTTIGFLRGRSMNVYSHPERINIA
jgi:FdhD protein